ncbi:insulin-like growth factor-binding protein complex acid labile subunit, partial [Hetaerina americana]
MCPLGVYFFLIYASVVARGSVEDSLSKPIFQGLNCTRYTNRDAISLHCGNGKVHLKFGIEADVYLSCDMDTEINPYRFLSIVDLPRSKTLSMRIRGCPPPDNGYFRIPVRMGDRVSDIGNINVTVDIRINCGDLKVFRLSSHYFREFNNIGHLDIDCPSLSHVPKNLFDGNCKGCRYVGIRNTALASIPDVVLSRLSNLISLNVSGNKLKSMFSLQPFGKLKVLDISRNEIGRLEAGAFQEARDLCHLNISVNQISDLPESLSLLEKLEILEAQSNRLRFLCGQCLAGLASLERLNLEGNQLKHLEIINQIAEETVPMTLFRGMVTQYLNLKNNELVSIPEDLLYYLEDLRQVDISLNNLSTIPSDFFRRNINLRTVVISGNLIESISEQTFQSNPLLEHLDLSRNRIRTLGVGFFSGMKQLKVIDLSHNTIAFLPDEIFEPLNTTDGRGEPMVLDLRGNRLTSLPILSLPRLTELNLSGNRLSRLPQDTLHHVLCLRRIDLSHNEIGVVEDPPMFYENASVKALLYEREELFHSRLANLSAIDLSHNRLDHFPPVHHVGKSLKYLNLSYNRINDYIITSYTHHVYFFLEFDSIEVIDVSHNIMGNALVSKALELPVAGMNFAKMLMLNHLDLSWNGLTLTECFEGTPLNSWKECDWFIFDQLRLEVLNLAHNKITAIPTYFKSLPKLQRVDFSHNMIKRVSFDTLFFVNGITEFTLKRLKDSPENYVQKEGYLELPNSHHLTIDLRHNEISEVNIPTDK